jgi:hypothetical protein
MSAAFSLDFSGDPVPCDFPGCTSNAYHDGDHTFLSEEELNARAAAAVTSYGVGTKSYNASAEKREMDRQRKVATARYHEAKRRAQSTPDTPLELAERKIAEAKDANQRSVTLTRAEWTAIWLKENSFAYDAPLLCRCPQRPWAHEISVHCEIRSEAFNPKLRSRWPWSLCGSARLEPSTERK